MCVWIFSHMVVFTNRSISIIQTAFPASGVHNAEEKFVSWVVMSDEFMSTVAMSDKFVISVAMCSILL